jgi:hypothetical protein
VLCPSSVQQNNKRTKQQTTNNNNKQQTKQTTNNNNKQQNNKLNNRCRVCFVAASLCCVCFSMAWSATLIFFLNALICAPCCQGRLLLWKPVCCICDLCRCHVMTRVTALHQQRPGVLATPPPAWGRPVADLLLCLCCVCVFSGNFLRAA